MKYFTALQLLLLLLFLAPLNAHAYLGPGLGAGTIGAIIGVIVSIFLAIFAVVYYPIKRLLKKSGVLKNKAKTANDAIDSKTEKKKEENQI